MLRTCASVHWVCVGWLPTWFEAFQAGRGHCKGTWEGSACEVAFLHRQSGLWFIWHRFLESIWNYLIIIWIRLRGSGSAWPSIGSKDWAACQAHQGGRRRMCARWAFGVPLQHCLVNSLCISQEGHCRLLCVCSEELLAWLQEQAAFGKAGARHNNFLQPLWSKQPWQIGCILFEEKREPKWKPISWDQVIATLDENSLLQVVMHRIQRLQ